MAKQLCTLMTFGVCRPEDVQTFLAEQGQKGSPHIAKAAGLAKAIYEELPRSVRLASWDRLAAQAVHAPDLLEPEVAALRAFGRPKTTKEDVLMLAAEGANHLNSLPQAIALVRQLDLAPADKANLGTRILALVEREKKPLTPESVALLANPARGLFSGADLLAARLKGVLVMASDEFGAREAEDFSGQLRVDLSRVKGLGHTQQRGLSQLESYFRQTLSGTPASDLLDLVASKYSSEGAHKSRERETRSFFATLGEAARLLRDRDAGVPKARTALKRFEEALHKSPNLRSFRRSHLGLTERERPKVLAAEFSRQTSIPANRLAAGFTVASPKTLDVAHDLSVSHSSLGHYSSCDVEEAGYRPEIPGKAMREVASAFLEGHYAEWKYSHELADHQLSHLPEEQRQLWKQDFAWSLPVTSTTGGLLRARESSDLRELLYFADNPAQTCSSLIGDGMHGYTSPSVLADANKKVVFVEDEKGVVVARSLLRTVRAGDGEAMVIVEKTYLANEDPRRSNLLQAGIVAGLGAKFSGKLEVAAGICMTDEHLSLVQNDAIGLASVCETTEVRIPASKGGYEYIDSCALVLPVVSSFPGRPRGATVPLSLLRNADRARNLPTVGTPAPCPSPFGGEEVVAHRTPVKNVMGARVLAKLIPDPNERAAFLKANPGCWPTGDVPAGSESAWGAVVRAAPQSAAFLHHAEFATATLRGQPDPARQAEDFRLAVAMAENQPAFRTLIHGRSRAEIARLKEMWQQGIAQQVANGPAGVWPPAIDHRPLFRSVGMEQPKVVPANPAPVSREAPARLRPPPEPKSPAPAPHPCLGQ